MESVRPSASTPEARNERPRRSASRRLFLPVLLATVGYGAYVYWDDAAEILRDNREEAKRREELRSKAAAHLEEARDDFSRARWEEAARRIEESLALSREGRDGAGEAEALLLRGALRAETGEWSAARADLDSAASVFEIYGVPEGRARALLERASLERDLGVFDRAEALYAQEKGPQAVLGKALLDLMRNDAASAERGLRAVYENEGAGDARTRAALYLGILASARGETEEAERWWNEARAGLGARDVDLFLGTPRTRRSDERRERLSAISVPPES
jgi:tetratricopeptide (TPR) repeat protein